MVGLLIAVFAGLAVLAASASARRQAIPARWKNCTFVNKRFPHGVGKLRAHDRTTGTPVTLQAQYAALPPRDALQPRARPRQGRHRLREALALAARPL
jgi:hypothetical protein